MNSKCQESFLGLNSQYTTDTDLYSGDMNIPQNINQQQYLEMMGQNPMQNQVYQQQIQNQMRFKNQINKKKVQNQAQNLQKQTPQAQIQTNTNNKQDLNSNTQDHLQEFLTNLQKTQAEMIAKLMTEFQTKSQELVGKIEADMIEKMKNKQDQIDAQIKVYKSTIQDFEQKGAKNEELMAQKMDVIIQVIQNAMSQLAQMNPNISYQTSQKQDDQNEIQNSIHFKQSDLQENNSEFSQNQQKELEKNLQSAQKPPVTPSKVQTTPDPVQQPVPQPVQQPVVQPAPVQNQGLPQGLQPDNDPRYESYQTSLGLVRKAIVKENIFAPQNTFRAANQKPKTIVKDEPAPVVVKNDPIPVPVPVPVPAPQPTNSTLVFPIGYGVQPAIIDRLSSKYDPATIQVQADIKKPQNKQVRMQRIPTQYEQQQQYKMQQDQNNDQGQQMNIQQQSLQEHEIIQYQPMSQNDQQNFAKQKEQYDNSKMMMTNPFPYAPQSELNYGNVPSYTLQTPQIIEQQEQQGIANYEQPTIV